MDLFDDLPAPLPAPKPAKAKPGVQPAPVASEVQRIAAAIPKRVRLGTSSWSFPGWSGLVWDGVYADTALAKNGLAAYAQHPALRTVSLDRTFYRPLSASQYAAYAAQVPDDVIVYTLYARSCDPTVEYLRRDGKLTDEQIVEAMVEATFHGLAGRTA